MSSSISLKPNKPEAYEGKRDFVTVSAWLYTVEQYLCLSQVSNPAVVIDDHTKIAFDISYLKGNAAIWWFHKVNYPETPAT